MDPQKKTIADSQCTATSIVLPEDANNHGAIFGGALLSLIDKCASVVAQRHSRSKVVTASFDRVDFRAPLKVGYIVLLDGRLTYVGRTSMEITVTVEGEQPDTGERALVCEAVTTFVALDESGKPMPVPQLVLETDEQRARFERGKTRSLKRS